MTPPFPAPRGRQRWRRSGVLIVNFTAAGFFKYVLLFSGQQALKGYIEAS